MRRRTRRGSFGALAPDLVLIDHAMPGMNGIEAITQTRKRDPAVWILVPNIHRGEDCIQ
jgi:CheY-like chemotaxis protein